MRTTYLLASAVAGVLLTAAPALAGSGSDDEYNGWASGSQYSQPYSNPYDNDQYRNDRYGGGQYRGDRLNDIDNARQRLTNAAVKDASGDTVGRVTGVDTDDSGDVRNIEVSLNDSDNAVTIPADEVTFDRDGDAVRTDLAWSQIRSMSGRRNRSYDDDSD